MSKEMILEKIKKIFKDTVEIETEGLDLETSITDDLDVDSLDLVEIVMATEDEFGIDIPEEDMTKIRTIGEFVDYLSKNI